MVRESGRRIKFKTQNSKLKINQQQHQISGHKTRYFRSKFILKDMEWIPSKHHNISNKRGISISDHWFQTRAENNWFKSYRQQECIGRTSSNQSNNHQLFWKCQLKQLTIYSTTFDFFNILIKLKGFER